SSTRPLTINKAHLTVKANDTSRLYGDADVFTATISGFKNSETLATSGVTASAAFSSGDTATSAAGTTWTITPSQGTLTAGNYDFTTFNTGTLTINKAQDPKSAVDGKRHYRDDAAYTTEINVSTA